MDRVGIKFDENPLAAEQSSWLRKLYMFTLSMI